MTWLITWKGGGWFSETLTGTSYQTPSFTFYGQRTNLATMKFLRFGLMTRPPSERILVSWESFRMIRRVLMARRIYFMAGLSSIYVPSRNEKYIITHNHKGVPIAREWPDLNGEMVWMTPGEAARTELERSFPNVKKIGWTGRSVKLFDWRWPMVYCGPYIGEGVYTDLVGAYHQIYSRLWLDVCFQRGFGSLPLKSTAERIGKWKAARNSVIGIIRSRQAVGYLGGTRLRHSTRNQFLSPHLWATVQGVLNEIAHFALSTGAIYIATDGYIHPVGQGALTFQEWLADCGLEFRSLAGDTVIRGWGNYRIGTKETQNFLRYTDWSSKPFESLDLPDRNNPTKLVDWWRKDVPRWHTFNCR